MQEAGQETVQEAGQETGLRERKKQATRRHLAEVAKGLFAARGFDDVTVAEVAEAADVSKMTVFNYFPRKEDLYLDQHAYQVRDVERALRSRAPGESPVAALRRYEHELLDSRHDLSGATEAIAGCWHVISASPALLARLHEQALELQISIHHVLADETGDPVVSRLVAGQLAAAMAAIFETALRRMVDGEDIESVRRDQAVLIDTAFELLERGIGDFGAAPAARRPLTPQASSAPARGTVVARRASARAATSRPKSRRATS